MRIRLIPGLCATVLWDTRACDAFSRANPASGLRWGDTVHAHFILPLGPDPDVQLRNCGMLQPLIRLEPWALALLIEASRSEVASRLRAAEAPAPVIVAFEESVK